MSEEKRLDEKSLNTVTGGLGDRGSEQTVAAFVERNCGDCPNNKNNNKFGLSCPHQEAATKMAQGMDINYCVFKLSILRG